MLRLRLAFLALASGLLISLSGCMTANPFSQSQSQPRLCGRLFGGGSTGGTLTASPVMSADCDCHQSYLPSFADPGIVYPGYPGHSGTESFVVPTPGPITMPPPTPIPITNMPVGQPPYFRTSPQAVPSPYTP